MGAIPLGPRATGPHTHSGWSSRGYLPHFDSADIWQAITYRLADAMPRHVVTAMERELDRFDPAKRDVERRRRTEAWADAGRGACLLARDKVATVVRDTWMRFAHIRYDLGPWVIMPNHVHLLIRVNPGHPLGKIVGSWKSFTSKQILRMTGCAAPIWWPDYWDRFIRDERHWLMTKRYIEDNPVSAGLVAHRSKWPWSSASVCSGSA